MLDVPRAHTARATVAMGCLSSMMLSAYSGDCDEKPGVGQEDYLSESFQKLSTSRRQSRQTNNTRQGANGKSYLGGHSSLLRSTTTTPMCTSFRYSYKDQHHSMESRLLAECTTPAACSCIQLRAKADDLDSNDLKWQTSMA